MTIAARRRPACARLDDASPRRRSRSRVSTDTPRRAPAGAADDYAAGLAAHERGDWQAVIDHMAKVIEDRPWHADAYNLAGFA